MRNVLIVGIMLTAVTASAQVTPVPVPANSVDVVVQDVLAGIQQIPTDIKYLGNDIKTNTQFKIDSAITYTAADWHTGTISVGEAVPFFDIGSYDYLAAGAAWTTSPFCVSQVTLMDGVRLNPITRPVITEIFNGLTLGNIDKVPLLASVANATTTGINVGHNLNGPSQKLIINTEGIWTGLEIAFGSGTTSVKKTGNIHFNDGGYHLYVR